MFHSILMYPLCKTWELACEYFSRIVKCIYTINQYLCMHVFMHVCMYIRIKSNAIKTWRFIGDMSPLSNANEKRSPMVYVENEGV